MFSKKSKTRRVSFSLRLALIYTCALGLTLSVVLAVTYQAVRHVTLSRDHDVIEAQTGQYSSIFRQGGIAAISEYFNQQNKVSPEPMFVRIIDENEQVRFITFFHPVWNLLDQKTNLWSRISSGAARWDELLRDEGTGSWIVGTTPLNSRLYLQVGRSNTESRLVLSHFRSTVLKVILPAVVLSFLVGWLMTRGAIAPLRSLIDTIGHILSTGDLQQRVPAHSQRGELGELTAMFNRLLDQNQNLIQVTRDALDNIAHDLRTPMTHLRNATEQVLLEPDVERDVLYNALADCAEESEKILRMLNLLMDTAEADAGQMTLKLEPVDLPDLTGEVIELYELVAEEREIQLKNNVPAAVIFVDHLRLRQCLANLVDNALKYSPKGGTVTLSGSMTSDVVELRVRDEGIGITEAELPRIWDRLYRGELSRSTSGLGLGLSFVKAIVCAHGGTVDVQTQMNVGSTFILRIPRSGSET